MGNGRINRGINWSNKPSLNVQKKKWNDLGQQSQEYHLFFQGDIMEVGVWKVCRVTPKDYRCFDDFYDQHFKCKIYFLLTYFCLTCLLRATIKIFTIHHGLLKTHGLLTCFCKAKHARPLVNMPMLFQNIKIGCPQTIGQSSDLEF